MSAASAVELHRVTVGPPQRLRLQIERLTVARGAMAAVLGPNGAGKSTLLKCLLGLQTPVQGEVLVLGRSLGSLSARQRRLLRHRMGTVPQRLTAPCEAPITVREVVSLGLFAGLGLFRTLTRTDGKRIDEWMERLGLGSLAHRSYGTLSGGEQRRVLLARALVHEPELLLLDEATSHLDLAAREELIRFLEGLHRQSGVTIILVCHELEAIPGTCDQVIVLNRGSVVASGATDEVLDAAFATRFYGPGLRLVRCGTRFALLPAGEED